MDKYIPPVQRSQAQSVARELENAAKAQRAAELAAAELATRPAPVVAAVTKPAAKPEPKPAPKPATMMPAVAVVTAPAPAPAPQPAIMPVARPAAARQGSWRVQLGAFGVPGNADKLWGQLSSKPALAGTRKTLLPSGKLTRLLATGFASEAEASRACASLKRDGQACVVAGQG
jgi:cell division septation protein DedD